MGRITHFKKMNFVTPLISINDSDFQNKLTESTEPVVVIFEKNFWGLAHVMKSILERLAVKYKGKVRFYKYNLDEYSEISNYYQVEDSTTVLFFSNGKLISRTGIKSIEEVEEILTGLTNKS